MSEDQFDESKFSQLLEWIYEVDQVTDPEARSRLVGQIKSMPQDCLLYTSPSPRDKRQSRMPSSA